MFDPVTDGKVKAEAVRMSLRLEVGEVLEVSNSKRYDGGIGGHVAWLAAMQLVNDGEAIELSRQTENVRRGPHKRPCAKRITVTIAKRDAI